MRRVITISLNGNAYQLEDDACELLSAYLDDAARALAADPDRLEIIADLEQAIAEKCARFLGAHKGVLARAEIAQVIAEMGPVDGAAAGAAGGGGERAGPAASGGTNGGAGGAGAGNAGGGAAGGARTEPRRLYQISEGAVISGVCNGIAAYFGVDVTLVRVLALVAAFLSAGLAVLAYLVLMFVVPYASTSEERAAAHGLPFNARVLVERAKAKYQEFAREAAEQAGQQAGAQREWRQGWRQARAEWRAARRQARAQWRTHWQWRAAGSPPVAPYPPAPAPVPSSYGAHVLARLMMALVGLLLAAIMVAWLLAFLSYLNSGTFFGHALGLQVPGWLVIVGLFVLYGMVTGPLRAVRRAAATSWHPYPGAWIAALDGLLMFAATIALLVYASHHTAEIQAFFGQLRDWLQGLTHPSAPSTAT